MNLLIIIQVLYIISRLVLCQKVILQFNFFVMQNALPTCKILMFLNNNYVIKIEKYLYYLL